MMLGGLTVGLAATILPACGLRTPFWPLLDYCQSADVERLRRAEAENQALVAELAALQSELAATPCAETAPTQETSIDETKWQARDISLLDGCWNLDSDYQLRDVQTNEPISVTSWTACFDSSGMGDQTVVFSDDVSCQGQIGARFDAEGQLHLRDVEDIPCDRKYIIVAREVSCQLSGDGYADCLSGDAGKSRNTPVKLKR